MPGTTRRGNHQHSCPAPESVFRNKEVLLDFPLSFVFLVIAAPILVRFDRPMVALAIATFFSLCLSPEFCALLWNILRRRLRLTATTGPQDREAPLPNAVVINAIDVLSEVLGLHGNTPLGRMPAGLILGLTMSSLIFSQIHRRRVLFLKALSAPGVTQDE